MPNRAYWSKVILIALCGASLRLVGLGHREPTVDELHYRGNMSNTPVFIRNHTFRQHSVRHTQGQVPHGLLAPALSFAVGRAVQSLFHLNFNDLYEQENLLARLSYAICGILLILLLFSLAYMLLGPETALITLGLAAFSPILVNWSRSEYLDTPMTLFLVASYTCVCLVIQNRENRNRSSLLSGLFAGLALAAKWPALIIIPCIPISYLAIKAFERKSMTWMQEDTLFLVPFFAGMVLGSLPFLSLDSFRWAIHPPAGAPYGDVNVPMLKRIALGMEETLKWHTLAAVGVYWLGLTFLPLLIYSLYRSLATLSPNVLLMLFIFIPGIPLTILQEGSWEAWRATYPVAGSTLLIAWGLSQMKYRKAITALNVALMIPITLAFGLRLRPAPISYFGSKTLYSTPLPPLDPNNQIFR